jgi:predicted transcriptional regulator
MKIRRDRMKIYGEILSKFNTEHSGENIVLTRIQIKIGVPFDRLKKYISELYDLGLIENENNFKLTEKGKQYLEEYENILDFMKRMGIAYR